MTSSQEAQAKEETATGQQTKPDPLDVTQLADGRSLIRHPAHGLLKLSRTGNNSHTLFGCDLRHPPPSGWKSTRPPPTGSTARTSTTKRKSS